MRTGSRFLFCAWPFPGHVFPQIAIAQALRRMGHECAFYTGAQLARVIEAERFPCFPFRHLDEARLDRLMRERPAEPWRLSSLPRLAILFRAWLLDTLPDQIRDIEDVAGAWGPDAIASDPTMWGPMLVLHEKLGIPVAVCSFVPACPLAGPDAPPWGPGLPRSGGWTASLLSYAVRASNRMSARVSRRTSNLIRRQHRLPPTTLPVSEFTRRMPLYLVPSAPEFDYQRRDLPASVRYVGPCLWNRPRTEPATPWIGDLRRDQPCVHVTEGTVHVSKPFVLQAALSGLGGLPIQVVATLGGRQLEELGLMSPPKNVRVERWVAHEDLLPHTDVMVTTGGAGSVLAALAAGVPLVIVPTEWDKPEIAQRVVEAGAGLRLAPARCTPARLRESVLRVLDDPKYKANARRMADVFAGRGGAGRAAGLLVDLARGSLARPA